MSRLRRVPGLVLALLILDLVLIQPNHPGAATWGALRLFPLELPLILALLVALPYRALRLLLLVFLVASVVLKAADMGFFLALGRGFNPVTDPTLLVAASRLTLGTIGLPLFLLAALVAVAALAALAAALGWALVRLTPHAAPQRVRAGAAVIAVLAGVYAVAEVGHAMRSWRLPFSPPGAAFTLRLGAERVALMEATWADLAAFRSAAATDPYPGDAPLLDRLQGRDVLVIFIESYGRASFDNPLYATEHDAIRAKAELRLAGAGLAVRSGWLSSPVEGGQSWLAHATLASGLSVGSHTRYAALVASPRHTLYDLAAAAGYRTAAVVPAITLAWPEAARLGFETVLDAAALGYKGLPFNWVTMPDQFTLARYPALLPPDPRPLFAQVVLISSHAPWVPVPKAVPWEDMGDGQVFDRFVVGADSPEVVWRSTDRIRVQYGQALGYSLETVFDFAARQGAVAPLMIILGDHPAAGFVAQVGGPDVPIHFIAPPGVLENLAGWPLIPGLTPAPVAEVWPMAAFRDRFLRAFSGARE